VTNWVKNSFGMETKDDDGADSRIEEVMKIFSGIGIMHQDTRKSSSFAISREHKRITNISGVIGTDLEDTSVSAEKFGRLLDTMEYSRRLRYEDLYAIARAMEKAGMDRSDVRAAFDVNFSKQAAHWIVFNSREAGKPKYLPYKLDRETSSRFKRARVQDKELAEEKWKVYVEHRGEMMRRIRWDIDKWEESK